MAHKDMMDRHEKNIPQDHKKAVEKMMQIKHQAVKVKRLLRTNLRNRMCLEMSFIRGSSFHEMGHALPCSKLIN